MQQAMQPPPKAAADRYHRTVHSHLACSCPHNATVAVDEINLQLTKRLRYLIVKSIKI